MLCSASSGPGCPTRAFSRHEVGIMKLMSAGFGAVVLGLTVLTITGCAGVSQAPVATSPADVPQAAPPAPPTTSPTSVAASVESTHKAPAPQVATPEQAPKETEADTEGADDVAAADVDDEDVQPAEETEPSPLDEIPEEVPRASEKDLTREKDIVANAPIEYDIPMVLNPRVAAYVDYFTSRGREFLEGSLDRSGRYLEAFQTVFEEAGIPKDLVYMA